MHGIAVNPGETEKRAHALALIRGAADRPEVEVEVEENDLITHQEHYGAGYAMPTPEVEAAIALVARSEAILLDPVYTGKAMAGMMHHISTGTIEPDETLIFLHTGGVPTLFAMA